MGAAYRLPQRRGRAVSEPAFTPPPAATLRALVETALREDGAWDDITTAALIPAEQRGSCRIEAREDGVLCGVPLVEATYALLDPQVSVRALVGEGGRFRAGDVLLRIEGPLRALLQGERVALNFTQRLSGIATMTSRFVEAVAGTGATILDTRKTTPGLRAVEKYAVRAGGGRNHRFGLSDGVLVKDNHLAVAYARGQTMADVVRLMRAAAPPAMPVEIEAASFDEAAAAIEAGADIVLLDNMTDAGMRRVVAMARGRARLEASGGMTLERVRAVAETGVDTISVGALTHSARALDLALEMET